MNLAEGTSDSSTLDCQFLALVRIHGQDMGLDDLSAERFLEYVSLKRTYDRVFPLLNYSVLSLVLMSWLTFGNVLRHQIGVGMLLALSFALVLGTYLVSKRLLGQGHNALRSTLTLSRMPMPWFVATWELFIAPSDEPAKRNDRTLSRTLANGLEPAMAQVSEPARQTLAEMLAIIVLRTYIHGPMNEHYQQVASYLVSSNPIRRVPRELQDLLGIIRLGGRLYKRDVCHELFRTLDSLERQLPTRSQLS